MVHKTGRLLVTMAAAVGLSILLPSQARAQGAGFQAGASVDPEQFFIGSHFETAPLVDRLHFRPGIDGGFGDGLKLATLNLKFGVGYTVRSRHPKP